MAGHLRRGPIGYPRDLLATPRLNAKSVVSAPEVRSVGGRVLAEQEGLDVIGSAQARRGVAHREDVERGILHRSVEGGRRSPAGSSPVVVALRDGSDSGSTTTVTRSPAS